LREVAGAPASAAGGMERETRRLPVEPPRSVCRRCWPDDCRAPLPRSDCRRYGGGGPGDLSIKVTFRMRVTTAPESDIGSGARDAAGGETAEARGRLQAVGATFLRLQFTDIFGSP